MTEAWYVPLLNSVVGVLVGAAVVYYFGLRQLAAQRRLTFRERQLAEFYAPLAGIRRQVRAKSEVRLKVSKTAQEAWTEVDRIRRERSGPGDENDTPIAEFRKIIEYENSQLRTELLPAYQEMLDLFTQRYHLADPETREFYEQFLEFVELWKRILSGSLPASVVEKLDQRESKLKPFYEHLEAKVEELQQEMKRG